MTPILAWACVAWVPLSIAGICMWAAWESWTAPAHPAAPAPAAPVRAVGRATVPPGCLATRDDITDYLEHVYGLPDYCRPPTATADSYIAPEDFQ